MDINKICKECGAEFVINDLEQNFYKQNDYELPKRCLACRRARKEANKNK